MISRRSFVAFVSGATFLGPHAGYTQQADRTRLLAVLMNASDSASVPGSLLATFHEALGKLGWTERTLRLETRWSAADPERARSYAAELVALGPDVILAVSTTNLAAMRRATGKIPIVFLQVSDPVGQGFISSLAQPGGNITGFSPLDFTVAGKWVGLLKEVAPELARVSLMFRPESSPQSQFFMRSLEAAAPHFAVEALAAPVHEVADIEPAMARISSQPNSGLILPTDSFIALHHQPIIDLAVHYRLPTISVYGGGALMEYNADQTEQYRQAAGYIDRILKGTKPADLPVQGATKFKFLINLKTAKVLGLTIPPTLLARADEVIE
ncbi:MAG TPA: ABC transporter substrate-binding protein [Stellaceae bacterium]|nr:ABC transporter substrate-binding protein [Stellaceae bacterium]